MVPIGALVKEPDALVSWRSKDGTRDLRNKVQSLFANLIIGQILKCPQVSLPYTFLLSEVVISLLTIFCT
jgi:hypothetical protein